MDLEATMLSEVNQIQKDKHHLFLSSMNPRRRGGQENTWKGGSANWLSAVLGVNQIFISISESWVFITLKNI